MPAESVDKARSLSKREAELVSWFEAERLSTVRSADVRKALAWSQRATDQVLSSLAKKGWVRRMARGSYETILAETGGWSIPNPWAALSTWKQRYYVAFQSAAYELGLTPDRPSSVQTCVPVGAQRPRAWDGMPIILIYTPSFAADGIRVDQLHKFPVWIATKEKVIVEAAANPGRVGGVLGLARILNRASKDLGWNNVVSLAAEHPNGRPALRRMATLMEILGIDVPRILGSAARARPGESPLFLADRRSHGAQGARNQNWQVIVNIDPTSIEDELRR